MPEILGRVAPRMGAEVLFEPEFRIVGRIRFRNGRHAFFWHNKFSLNPVSSARLARDKGYADFFLRAAGISVPPARTFFRDDFRRHIGSPRGLQAACRFAAEVGWPVYVKPCGGSQGRGIEIATGPAELRAAARRILAREKVVLVQKACPGRDYRLVVLDGRVISAYERIPLGVTGDGRSNIREMLERRQQEFIRSGRDTRLNLTDRRLRAGLRRHGLRLSSVLPAGRQVQLLEVANLSCGGDSVDVTRDVHPSYRALAARVARALDLRLAGVDLLAKDIRRPRREYFVLEVNSAPGLDHYAAAGPRHVAEIDRLYRLVLAAIARGPRYSKLR